MTKYLLDTDILIDLLAGRPNAEKLIENLYQQGDTLGICAVNIAELYSGLSPIRRSQTEPLIDNLYCFEVTTDAAKRAGAYRYDFARKGLSLSVADTLIASVAAEYSATLVTGNLKDFPMNDVHSLGVTDR